MTILRILFYAFLVYLAFRLVFHFIIPLYRTTKKIKKGFREMQERMQHHQGPYNQPPGPVKQSTGHKKGEAGDYIEFEEVK